MQGDAKAEYLQVEGDKYFERNLKADDQLEATLGAKIFCDFICNQMSELPKYKVLEIGCCYGYNLAYLNRKCGFEVFGVEPSNKAIAYGKELFGNTINFTQGTADDLRYSDNFFNVILVGSCLYQVDRTLLVKTLSEIDRVLLRGGFLVITDFDTPLPCKRENQHNHLTPTYKDDYGEMFLHSPYNYFLVAKRTYSFNGELIFPYNIQERVSTQILYKEMNYYSMG